MWRELARGTTLRAAVVVEVGCRGCLEGVIDERNSGWVHSVRVYRDFLSQKRIQSANKERKSSYLH